jgi:hypothetical protein
MREEKERTIIFQKSFNIREREIDEAITSFNNSFEHLDQAHPSWTNQT